MSINKQKSQKEKPVVSPSLSYRHAAIKSLFQRISDFFLTKALMAKNLKHVIITEKKKNNFTI